MGYIYHGSTISNLKVIEPHSSTQAGSYVYGSPNYLVAVIFSIILFRTGKLSISLL